MMFAPARPLPAHILLAAAPLALATAAASAQPFSVSSGFETSSDWIRFFTSGATSQFVPDQGNPGNCLSITLNLQDSFRENTATYWTTTFTLGGPSPVTDIALSAQYRHVTGPAVEFAPALRQSGRLYFPDPHLLLGDNDGWTDTGSITVPLSAFSNSTGIPLSPTLPTYVGFVIRYIHPGPTTLTAEVAIDNLNIEVIPSPAAASLAIAAAAPLVTRRRRPAPSPR